MAIFQQHCCVYCHFCLRYKYFYAEIRFCTPYGIPRLQRCHHTPSTFPGSMKAIASCMHGAVHMFWAPQSVQGTCTQLILCYNGIRWAGLTLYSGYIRTFLMCMEAVQPFFLDPCILTFRFENVPHDQSGVPGLCCREKILWNDEWQMYRHRKQEF